MKLVLEDKQALGNIVNYKSRAQLAAQSSESCYATNHSFPSFKIALLEATEADDAFETSVLRSLKHG